MMPIRQEEEVVKLQLNNNLLEVNTVLSWYEDPNYGADADGNRGIHTSTLEDVFVLSVYNLYSNKYICLNKRNVERIKNKIFEMYE